MPSPTIVVLELLFVLLSQKCCVRGAELLPKGENSSWIDDEDLHMIRLSKPLNFFGRKYNDLYISDDGVIAFHRDMKGNTNKPKEFPYEQSVIAPLWHDFNGVKLYQREITDSSRRSDAGDLSTISDLVKKTHPDFDDNFSATWAMILTWFNTTRYNDDTGGTHTFQAVLVSNENATFVLFLYGEVNNAANAQIGVNSGHCNSYYTLCISMSEDTNDTMELRPCDGDYGVFGFWLDDIKRSQPFYVCTPAYHDEKERESQCECSSSDIAGGEIVTEQNTVKVGETLTYSCAQGYHMIGDSEMACWYNGVIAMWDGFTGSCIQLPKWLSPPPEGEYDIIKVREDASYGKAIYTLQASAGDGSANFSYSFVKQTPSRPFTFVLDGNEVQIGPDADLDVDNKNNPSSYILHFRVTDKRYEMFTDKVAADAFLIVQVLDMNDNSPKFQKSRYSKAIEGDKEIGSYILGVTAVDKDLTCPNNQVHYQFYEQSLPGYFSIDQWDGTIRLIKQPNTTQYDMTIKAADGANRFDAARVTIYVNNLVTTTTTIARICLTSTTTTIAPTAVAMTTSESASPLPTTVVVVILVVIVVALIIGVTAFVYRRYRRQKQTSVSATFKQGSSNVVLDNPNFVSNYNTDDPHNFRQPSHRNSTNEPDGRIEHDTHSDTQVLTTDSWRKEKERGKTQTPRY